MLKKPSICNGQATGVPCIHYWFHTQKVESNDPDALKDGEKHRACLISPGFPVEFSEEEVPHVCNQYKPRRRDGVLGLLGFKEKYNPKEEEYDPLTPEEIAAMRAADEPDGPETHFFAQTAGMGKSNLKAARDSALPILGQDIPDPDATPADVEAFLASLNKDKK